jgi:UDP-4-amino-4,6-dideoxy-N-acetyl-beta-L-altrosamine transaminase
MLGRVPGELLPYGRQSITEDDIAAVVEALRAPLLTCGPEVERFEAALASFLDAPHVSVCANGTAALHLAYAALGLGAGDEVITSPITFSATASAAYQVGATVRFADVEPDTGNLDPASVEAMIGPRTRAITVVHLAGLPVDLASFRALADRHGLFLVEDACHALGATFRGRPVATAADAAVLSFHPVKHITTFEGGAVIVRDPERKRRIDRLRHHGIERDPARLSIESPGPWYHEVVEQGFNYRLPDVACALGRSQLARLPAQLAHRRALAARYDEELARRFGDDGVVRAPARRADRESAFHLYAVAIDFARARTTRARVMDRLRADGIGTQVHYVPLPQHPFHRARAGAHAALPRPGADHYYARTLSLPLYADLRVADVARVADALERALAETTP